MVISSIITIAHTRVLCPERALAAYAKLDWLSSLSRAFSRVWNRPRSVQKGWNEAEWKKEKEEMEEGKKILTGQGPIWLMGINMRQHQYESLPHNHKLAGVADRQRESRSLWVSTELITASLLFLSFFAFDPRCPLLKERRHNERAKLTDVPNNALTRFLSSGSNIHSGNS